MNYCEHPRLTPVKEPDKDGKPIVSIKCLDCGEVVYQDASSAAEESVLRDRR